MCNTINRKIFIILLACMVTLVAGITVAYGTVHTGDVKSVKNVDNGIKVTWDADNTFTGYVIYKRTGSSTTWVKTMSVSSGDVSEWIDTNVSNGTKYKYKVQPVSELLNSSSSTSKTTYRLRTPSVTLTSARPGTVKVKTDSNTKVTGYEITYSKNSDLSSSNKKKVKTTALSKTIVNLNVSTRYYVKVRAYKYVNGTYYYSDYSNVKSQVTDSPYTGYIKLSKATLKTASGKAVTIRYKEKLKILKTVKYEDGRYRYKATYHGSTYYIWSNPNNPTFTSKNLQNYTSSNEKRQKILNKALSVFNKKTVYKSCKTGQLNSNGKMQFDCVGFASYVLNKSLSKNLPYSLTKLYYKGTTVCSGTWNKSKVKPGDLIFFNSKGDKSYGKKPVTHVGIYLGNNEYIHCSSYYGKVVISKITTAKNFKKAKRYI